MTILEILAGAAAVTSRIILAKRSGRKVWHIFTVVGALIFTVSLFLMICTLLLTEGIQNQQPVGDYWRVTRLYSDDYTVGDGKTYALPGLLGMTAKRAGDGMNLFK